MKSKVIISFLSLLTFLSAHGKIAAQPPANSASAQPQHPPFSASFIQYQGWMQNQTIEDWTKEIESMRTVGINSVVLQWLAHNSEKFYEGQFHRMNEALLTYADTHGMSVYLGLWFGDEFWNTATNVDAEYHRVAQRADQSGKLVKETGAILSRLAPYTRHPSFKGWYIPQEYWNANYDLTQQNRLKVCLKKMSDLARATHQGRVLISPIFNPTIASPAVTTDVYKNVFQGSGITDVLVQDGAGAKQWDTDEQLTSNIPPYLAAFKAATNFAGAKFWCNIESFEGPSNGPFHPAPFSRLKKQIEIESRFADKDNANRPLIITFDFFHYMSDVHPNDPQHTFSQRKALRDAYAQAFPNR